MQTTCEKSWSAFCHPLLAYYFNIKILKTKDLEFSNIEPTLFFQTGASQYKLTHFLGGEGVGVTSAGLVVVSLMVMSLTPE